MLPTHVSATCSTPDNSFVGIRYFCNRNHRGMKKYFWIVITLSLLLGLQSCSNPSAVNFENLTLKTLDGQDVDLSAYKGKKIFLNFWATWCGPCRAELPSMAQAQQVLGDEYVFLLVSDEAPETLISFKNQAKLPFTFLHKPTSIKMLGIFSIPQTYLINSEGEVVHDLGGAHDWMGEKKMAMLKGLK